MLQMLVDTLSEGRSFYLSVSDLQGVFSSEGLQLDKTRKVHPLRFCDIAKSTPEGYCLCIRCKKACNALARKRQTAFSGYCPYGLYEYVYPVVSDGVTLCVLYLGNLLRDPAETERRVRAAGRKTGVDTEALLAELKNCDAETEDAYLRRVLELVRDTILLLYRKSGVRAGNEHWAVTTAKDFADTNYWQNLSLRSISRLCYINEKYLGRLFKKQTGMTFHAYLTQLRLFHCENALRTTDRPIAAIALENGFPTVTYFNRLFREKHGCTPGAWRKKQNGGS